jgi:CheY-like chemotaxis protein
MWNLKPCILVCEDDPNDALFLKRSLAKAGITNPLFFAEDGVVGIEYLEGNGKFSDRQQYPFPGQIITDLKMPRKNGFDILVWLKNHPDCSVIPAIVWSSSAQASDVKKAYELGANCYLQKPSRHEDWVIQLKLLFDFWNTCQIPRLGMSSCAEQNPPDKK